jgi:hypothetical protein
VQAAQGRLSWALIAVGLLLRQCASHLPRVIYLFLIPNQLPIITPMSQNPQAIIATSASSSNFRSVFDTALDQYKRKTRNDLVAHRFTALLESCTSPSAILAVLNEQCGVQEFIQSQRGDERPKQWLNATANVLCAFSAVIGQGAGLVNSSTSTVHLHPNTHSPRSSHQPM